ALGVLVRPLELHGESGRFSRLPHADVADLAARLIVVEPAHAVRIGDRFDQLMRRDDGQPVERRQLRRARGIGRAGAAVLIANEPREIEYAPVLYSVSQSK